MFKCDDHDDISQCSINGKISKHDHGGGVLDRRSYNFTPEIDKLTKSLTHDLKLENILRDQSWSGSETEMTPFSASFSSNTSNGTPNSKSSLELVREIASLETEILHLERYILSLYRTVFQPHVHSIQTFDSTIEHMLQLELQPVADQAYSKVNSDARLSDYPAQLSPMHEETVNFSQQITPPIPKSSHIKDRKIAHFSHRSLGDHLDIPCTENAILDGPDRLSEDIIRCISSIYCKLGDQNQSRSGPLVSSATSMSSSGTNFTRKVSDTWSPYCNDEATWDTKQKSLKEKTGPYAEMIEVLKISVDDDGFSYASRILKKFRALVKRLENVDPTKMKREQKLAFWINIHNALVMHAYLAYGTQNSTKSNSLLKATYNIGGHSINAYVIQISILGIKSHFKAPSLLSIGRKLKTDASKHIYAIEYPEPLVHFALSLGAFSDPAVRIYNAKNIFQDLRLAKEEFIQSTVYVNNEKRIYLPKILYYFAKDLALTMIGLLEIVNSCLSEHQQKALKACIKGKPEKYVYWLSQSCIFRYVIQLDKVEGRLSV
ncbi:uncharacterized protein [Rutidosis leptorrhynchoides]|uniref:uncharacterized protein n=1 Tax=Rutidosis leptorrhynchoides TaxID=125765 RepID=UPI003A9A3C8B